MTELQTIQTNDLTFAYHEAGSGDQLVLCLHGFPDTADTWRDLLPRLADAGFRAVAPYMRGYPPTQIPADAQYTAKHMAEDVLGLIDAFGAEQAIVIGHDWGAFATYAAAALAPERIVKLVTLAIPHPRAISFTPRTLWTARHFVTFQMRGRSVRWLRANNFAALRRLYQRWSPKWSFSDSELTAVKASLSQPGGVEGALGYYWSFIEGRSNSDVQRLLRKKTGTPTLSLLGDADGALPLGAIKDVESAYTGSYQQIVLPDVGHFLHREAPELVAKHILAFLAAESEG